MASRLLKDVPDWPYKTKADSGSLGEVRIMSLVRNKASGKYFIVLDVEEEQNGELLMITPEGKVKRLERRLFGALQPADPGEPAWSGRLTVAQRQRYEEYLNTFSPRS